MKIELNDSGLEDRMQRAFERYSQLLEAQFTKEISTKQFTWPTSSTRGRSNRRGGREAVSSPRDIIDSGAFRQSQLRTPIANGFRFTWTVPYSLYILKGYRTSTGRQMPARNWIEPALTKLPPLSTLQKLLR